MVESVNADVAQRPERGRAPAALGAGRRDHRGALPGGRGHHHGVEWIPAAKWDGRESAFYQEATRDRFRAEAASTLGGLALVSDSALFTSWLQARADHDPRSRRNSSAGSPPTSGRTSTRGSRPTEPAPQPRPISASCPATTRTLTSRRPLGSTPDRSDVRQGEGANGVADRYVRNTVLLATVLFLIAIAQRFPTHGFRIGVNAGAFLLLVYVVISTATLPRLS